MNTQVKETTLPQLSSVTDSVTGSLTRHQFDVLTSLRFFACAAIIFLHSAWFFFDINFMQKWQLDEGVAFFFVLSGFILTYVYPRLKGASNIKHFLANRLGRMVPTHILLTFLILCILPCSCANVGTFLANLFLVQSWIPRREYYFGLNAVAWSICVEIFFSFAFVLLIRPWKWGWAGKIGLSLLLTFAACIWAHLFITSGSHGFFKFNEEYLLKINPLVRSFDFILGMATARIWMRFGHLVKLGKWQITFIEVALISIILFEITQINNLIENYLPVLKHYPALTCWMLHGGCAPIFVILIFVMALERGYIAKAFANPALVWLGEVSYSMYMLHFILIQSLSFYLPEFGKLNWPVMYPIYLAMVVLLSYLNFNLVENPARKLVKEIVSSSKKFNFSLNHILSFFTPNIRSTVVSALLVITLATAAGAYIVKSQDRFHYAQLNIAKDIDFEDCFHLENIAMASASDGSKINLTWRSLKPQTLNRNVETFCLNKTGNMLYQHEQKDMFPRQVKQNESWTETIYMPSHPDQRLQWNKLGLRVSIDVADAKQRHMFRILAPHGGNIDWWATRLNIPLSKAAL